MQRDASKSSTVSGGLVKKLKNHDKIAPSSARQPQAAGLGRSTMAAFALGFACVAAAVYAGSGDVNRAFARDDGGMYDFLPKARSQKSAYPAPVFYTPSYRAPVVYQPPSIFNLFGQPDNSRNTRVRGLANLPRSIAPLRQGGFNQPHQLTGATDVPLYVDASGLPRRSYCVRLCDGYYFPVAPVKSDSDLNGHESLCAGICPGAPTRLFVMPGGTERIEEATSRDGHKYSALPVAFRHTGTTDNTCTCRPDNIAHTKIVSVLKDFTLRQGDMVMSGKGLRVFRGASHYPYGQTDFMSLAESGINSKNRAALSAIEAATKHAGARLPEPASAKSGKTALSVSPGASPPDEILVQANGKRIRRIGPQVYLGE